MPFCLNSDFNTSVLEEKCLLFLTWPKVSDSDCFSWDFILREIFVLSIVFNNFFSNFLQVFTSHSGPCFISSVLVTFFSSSNRKQKFLHFNRVRKILLDLNAKELAEISKEYFMQNDLLNSDSSNDVLCKDVLKI